MKISKVFISVANFSPAFIRLHIYKLIKILPKRDNRSDIRKNIYIDIPRNLSFGYNVIINHGVQFHIGADPNTKIILKDNVSVGMNVCFICVSHEISNSNRRAGKNKYGSIIVGKGVWIGANTTILQGVSIGDGCVIGAGSLIIHNCESNCLYAGIPARKIKRLN